LRVARNLNGVGMATSLRKILVPHDFSPAATQALKVAVDLAARERGRVTVLHVLTPLYSGPGYPTREEIDWTPPAEMVREREGRLRKMVEAALGRRAARVTCRAVLGETTPAILDAAKGMDLIVMATLGRTGLAHLLIGSVAEKVVRHSAIPVLTVRPTAARRTPRKAARGRTR
jgi:nucleotide-binding universal stress UspA family protein